MYDHQTKPPKLLWAGCGRGMRLVDTVFLTLAAAALQAYVGMRCGKGNAACAHRSGFDPFIFLSVVSALASASLCFMAIELNDKRLARDRSHAIELAAFFIYRLFELGARISILALFAVRTEPSPAEATCFSKGALGGDQTCTSPVPVNV